MEYVEFWNTANSYTQVPHIYKKWNTRMLARSKSYLSKVVMQYFRRKDSQKSIFSMLNDVSIDVIASGVHIAMTDIYVA